jgi:hypothetical protein
MADNDDVIDDNVTDTVNQDDTTAKPEDVVSDKPEDKPADTAPKDPHWLTKRINREVAKRNEILREKEALEAELKVLRAANPAAKPVEDIQKLVEDKAKELIQVREFNQKCDMIYEDGIAEYGDFTRALETLKSMNVVTTPFLELVTDLDDGHKVLYHLGKNPEEADRIQNLPPAKQALALAKLQNSLDAPKKPLIKDNDSEPATKVSKAPKPIEPVDTKLGKNSSGWATKYYDGMSQEEFNEWDNRNSRKRG